MAEGSKITAEEEARILAAKKAYDEQQRQAALEAEARNRILDAQRKQPGFKYH